MEQYVCHSRKEMREVGAYTVAGWLAMAGDTTHILGVGSGEWALEVVDCLQYKALPHERMQWCWRGDGGPTKEQWQQVWPHGELQRVHAWPVLLGYVGDDKWKDAHVPCLTMGESGVQGVRLVWGEAVLHFPMVGL